MKRAGSHITTFILVVMFAVGLGLLLYPTVADYWNRTHQSRAIAAYSEQISQADDDTLAKAREAAQQHNAQIASGQIKIPLTSSQEPAYNNLLNVTDTGIMGYIEIPQIKCSLPVYHGTSDEVLQTAIGHIAGSSLPVGGESTHCVLSGHRGLPSARLFTDIDQLVVGDLFYLYTLDEVLAYEVDQILIVLPHETESLAVEEGKDLCTLITCTPYGVNTHRLLVRGHRVDANLPMNARVTADALQVSPYIVAPVVALPLLLILLIWVIASGPIRKRRSLQK